MDNTEYELHVAQCLLAEVCVLCGNSLKVVRETNAYGRGQEEDVCQFCRSRISIWTSENLSCSLPRQERIKRAYEQDNKRRSRNRNQSSIVNE